MTPASPAFGVAEPAFPFRALSQAAARAPLGGAREALMATLLAARLARSATSPAVLPAALRAERAAAARQWLGAQSLGAGLRGALLQLVGSTAGDERAALVAALRKVTDITAPHLDRKARFELERLARELDGGASPLVRLGQATV